MTSTDGPVLPADLTHYVVPDAGAVLNYLEILEFRELQGIVFTQTAVQNLSSRGRRYVHAHGRRYVHAHGRRYVYAHGRRYVHAQAGTCTPPGGTRFRSKENLSQMESRETPGVRRCCI